MPITKEEILDTINNLIETCEDGKYGYLTAAEGIKDERLKHIFTTYSEQRNQFTKELKSIASNYTSKNGEVKADETLEGLVGKGWMEIKKSPEGEHGFNMLEECEKGENIALDTYKESAELNLPEDLCKLIKAQLKEIAKAQSHILSLKELNLSDKNI